MSKTVYMLLGETPSAPLTYLSTDGAGTCLRHKNYDTYADFMMHEQIATNDRLIAFLPGEFVTLRLIESPPKSKQQFQAAAKYLLEDSLAEDIENMHVSTAVRQPDTINDKTQAGLCLAVQDTLMAEWYDVFTGYNIFPDLMTADFLGLPLPQEIKTLEGVKNETGDTAENSETHELKRLTVFAHKDGLLLNGTQGGLSMDLQTAGLVIADIMERWNPDKVDLYAANKILSISDPEKVTQYQDATLETLAGLFDKAVSNPVSLPNLLRGKYGRTINWQVQLVPFRGVGIAACLCLMVVMAGWVFDGLRANRLTEHYQAVSREIHINAFPQAVSEAPVQYARRVLGTRSRNLTFLNLWAGFGTSIEAVEGVQVDSISFTENGRAMRISINVETLDALNAFKLSLKEQGIVAEEGRLNQNRGGQYAGELTVEL